MRTWVSVACLGVASVACTPVCGPESGDQSCRLRGPDGWRPIEIVAPQDLSEPLPLVLNLHGGGGSGSDQAIESEMSPFAREQGFLLVYPTSGRAEDGKRRWNSGERQTEGRQGTEDDVAYLLDLIDQIGELYPVDPGRIYMTGLSNGAQMTYRFACEAGDRIAAAAAVAGTQVSEPPCTPPVAVPMLILHGTADSFIPFNGGPSIPELGAAGSVEDQIAIPAVTEFWAQNNGCTQAPMVSFEQGEVRCEAHRGCTQGAEVQLCTIEGGGHNWPGSEAYPIGRTRFGRVLTSLVADHWPGHVTQDIDANEAVWSFFQRIERTGPDGTSPSR